MGKQIFKLILIIQIIIVFLPGQGSTFSLEEAVRLALANNPNLQKQQMNRELSEKDFSEKKSQNFGRIDLVASYNHFNLPRTLVPLTPVSIMDDPSAVPITKDLFVTGVMYEIPIFTGFAQKSSVEIAALQKEITGSAIKLSREKLIYNVKTLYVNILALNAQKDAQELYIKALQGLSDVISQEVTLGKRARVEQLKAAAELESAKAQASRIYGNIKIVKASLAGLLNIDTIPVLENISIDIAAHEKCYDPNEINNLERYRSAKLNEEKNEKLVRKSNSVYFPQISFNAFIGRNFGENDSSSLNSGEWNSKEVWQTGINMKWNIFDFGNKNSKSQKAKIRKRQSRLEKQNVELEIKKDLIKAGAEIETAVSRYNSAKAELIMTREMESIEQIRFDKGAISLNDLLYAKARNQQALGRFINAGYTYLNDQFYLDYLLEDGENK